MSTSAVTPNQDQFQFIKLPDGSYGKFRGDATDADIKAAVAKDFPDAYSEKAPVSTGTANQYLESAGLPTTSDTARAGGDLLTGASQGAASTVGNSITGIASLLNKIPGVGKYLSPQVGINALQAHVDARSAPENTAQNIGKVGEQVGEMMLPTGIENKAVSMLPKLGKAARFVVPAVRIGTQAGEMGIRNASQGGTFKEGATAGAVGGVLGEAGKALAPKIAEAALGVTDRLRGHDKTIGEAALNEVSGVRPATLLENSKKAIGDLTNQLETAARASKVPTSTTPALQIIANAVGEASAQNSGPKLEKLQQVWDQLTKEYGTGNAIPTTVNAKKILDLKRGIGDLVKSWSPQDAKGLTPLIQQVYGALDGELDKAVPISAEINQRISSLIPVKQRSAINANRAGIFQRLTGRVAAHTGALAGAGIGAAAGYREGGTPGAIAGSTAGLILPELAATPTALMTAARLAKSKVPIRLGTGLGLQLLRPSNANPNQ